MKSLVLTLTVFLFSLLKLDAQISFEDNVPEYFHSSGTAVWQRDAPVAYDGNYSLKSGDLTNTGYSELYVNLNLLETNTVSFYKKIDAVTSTDTLFFLIDGNVKAKWSGSSDWTLETFNVTAGVRTFKWIYKKDNSKNTKATDCAWIDFITFPLFNFETSVSENDAENITLFPNPSPGEVFIKSDKNISSIMLKDITGRISDIKKDINKSHYSLNIKDAGIYFLEIYFTDKSVIRKKIIISR